MIAEPEISDCRVLPQDTDAESGLVGSLVLLGDDRAKFSKVRRLIAARDFTIAEHGILFGVLCDLHDRGVKFDGLIVRAELERRGTLKDLGGIAGLVKILNAVPSAAHAEHYAEIVAEKSREREAINICTNAISRLYSAHRYEGGEQIIADAWGKLRRIGQDNRRNESIRIGDAVQSFLADAEVGICESVRTGFQQLDQDYLGVVAMGGYTLVAARPSMGKSTFIRSLLADRARAGMSVGLIAREERQKKIAGNYLSAESRIENSRLANPPYNEEHWRELLPAASRIDKWKLIVNDSARTIEDVIAAAESMVMEHGCQIIAVDHLHLIGTRYRYERTLDRLTEVSHSLKDLWKELGVAGIVAAQLSRPPKGTIPDPPEPTDLRECGALEEHADSILFLHREDYYHRNDRNWTPDGKCHVGIAKNRNGPVGGIMIDAELQVQTFTDNGPEDIFADKPARAPRVDVDVL